MSRSELYKYAKELGLQIRWNSPAASVAALREAIPALEREVIERYTPARRPEGYDDVKVARVFEDAFGPYERVNYRIGGADTDVEYYEGVERAIADFIAKGPNPDVDLVLHFTSEASGQRFITVTRDEILIAGGDVRKAVEAKLEKVSQGEVAGSDTMGEDFELDMTFVTVKTGSLLGEGEGVFDFAETAIQASKKRSKGDCFWRTLKMVTPPVAEEALEAARTVNTIAAAKDWAAKYGTIRLFSDVPEYKVNRAEMVVIDSKVYQAIELCGLKLTDTFTCETAAASYDIMYKALKAGKGHFELLIGPSRVKYYVDCKCNIYSIVDAPTGGRLAKIVRKGKTLRSKASAEVKRAPVKVEIITFDFETVFDPSDAGLLIPYSVSWSVRANDAISGRAFFYYGWDCVKVLVDWIATNQKGRKYVLVGYNSSRFDNFFLINELMTRDLLSSCKLVNGSILKMKFSGRHEVFDLCRYLACPLAVACDQFKPVYRKQGDLVSHVAVQEQYNSLGCRGLDELFGLDQQTHREVEFDGVTAIKGDLPSIVRYNILDVLSTDCLYMMIDKILRDEKIIAQPLYAKSTIGGLAWSLLQTHFKQEEIQLPKLPIDKYRAVRGSLFAGRTQAYKGLYSETSGDQRYDMYDAKSLYPYVYLNRNFPCGEVLDISYKSCKARKLMGFYEVDYEQPASMRVKVLPKREAGEALDWTYEGRLKTMVNTVDIEQLVKYGATIHSIGAGFAFSSKIHGGRLFKPMGVCKTIKESEDRKPANLPPCEGGRNNVLRNMSKLLINSASGKVIQRVFQKTEKVCKTPKELKTVHEKVTNVSFTKTIGKVSVVGYEKSFAECFKKQNMPIYLGCFIYAHARAHMMDSVLADYQGLYQDTDSLLMPRSEAERFKREKPHLVGGEFGQFELEDTKGKDIAKVVVIAPKCYFLFSEDDTLLKRGFKGVNMRQDKVLTAEDVDEMIEQGLATKNAKGHVTLVGGLREQFDAYHTKYAHRTLAKAENVARLCNSLKSGGTAHILTSSLRKSTEELTISQRFTIKNVTVKASNA